jgi:hypothetical protein
VLAGTVGGPPGPPALTVVVPHAPAASGERAAQSLALPIVSAEPNERALSVHYRLDQVTHRWVASIMDDHSGEVVRTVPSTQVLHQLAALRRPPLDLHA